MNSYTVHLKGSRPPLLQREGWSWGAFLFGPLWLASKLAWVPAMLEIASLAVLLSVTPAAVLTPVLLAVAVLNGLLGRDIVRWSLERRGYALRHVVLAANHEAALLRLFTARPELAATAS